MTCKWASSVWKNSFNDSAPGRTVRRGIRKGISAEIPEFPCWKLLTAFLRFVVSFLFLLSMFLASLLPVFWEILSRRSTDINFWLDTTLVVLGTPNLSLKYIIIIKNVYLTECCCNRWPNILFIGVKLWEINSQTGEPAKLDTKPKHSFITVSSNQNIDKITISSTKYFKCIMNLF